MMDYTESICFSAETAEELNRKAFSLDCRLFMFAYYEPKQYREAESIFDSDSKSLWFI